MFSLRIVNVDFYQSFPTKGYDICYSEFRGCEIYKVPIIRIFGITPAGQKGCLHVHGVFPYFSIRCKDVFPNIEAKSLRKCMQELALDIDKALNVASRNSNSHRHHVYKIVVAEHKPFYGFHEKAEEFLKIYFYNPFDVSRTAELMTNGVILNKFIQPYEAHIPYILQFFIDYNLFGMNLIHVSKFKFRASEEEVISPLSPRNQSVSLLDDNNTPSNKIWNIGILSSSQISHLQRQTVCELEIDCCSSEIMNRLNESFSSGKNPGLLAIWEEERQRRIAENDTSLITPVPSQERTDFIETESENFFKKKLRKILESFDVFKVCQKDKFDRLSKDMRDVPSPNVSDLSSTQDEEMLNMMLSLANSQSTQLDDDSILGLNHQSELQNENTDDETIEMSQLFTGELEEMWSSQSQNSDKNRISKYNLMEQSFNDNTVIPQLDGAFDEEFETGFGQSKKNKRNAPDVIDEEALIKSCTLYQPVVRLTPAEIVKTATKSPVENRSECSISYKSKKMFSSEHSHKRNSLPVCVPVSKNAHCSLIMNFNENSNDVSIEHTCSNRNSASNNCLATSEDPSDIVFELLTNLIYKVECLTEGKTSCYEYLTEEFQGERSSDILLRKLTFEEKCVLQQIKSTPSDYKENSPFNERENYVNANLSLPIKKRIFSNNWNKQVHNQCNSCTDPFPFDLSKIGREVVLIKKLSQSDFIKYFKLNSLKVVIPPLPPTLNVAKDSILKQEKDNNNFKHSLSNKELKSSSKKTFKSKHSEIYRCEKLALNVTGGIIHESEANPPSCDQLQSFDSTEQSLTNDQLKLLESTKQSSPSDQLESFQSAKQSPSDVQLESFQSAEQSPSNDQLVFRSAKQSDSTEFLPTESPILNNVISPILNLSDSESRQIVHLNKSQSIRPKFDEFSHLSFTKANSDTSDSFLKGNSLVMTDVFEHKIIQNNLNLSDSLDNSKPFKQDSLNFEKAVASNSNINEDCDTSKNSHTDEKALASNSNINQDHASSGILHVGEKAVAKNSKIIKNSKILQMNEKAVASNLTINQNCENSKISHSESVVSERSFDTVNSVTSPKSKDFKDTYITTLPDFKMHSDIDSNSSGEDEKSTRINSNCENFKTVDCTEVGKNKSHDSIMSNETNNINATKAEFENPIEEKKLPTMSELRLYRRKKMISKELPFYGDISSKNSLHQSSTIGTITTSIGSRVREKNSSDLQIEYVGVSSKPKFQESTQTCVPVVQLEPCKELIDKYCRNETDSDCLILREVDKDHKILPAVKEKRFFRSRAHQPKNHNLSSNVVINHKLGLNNSKNKSKKFLLPKRGTANSISSSASQKSNTQILRKRSANFDSPSKKKLQFNTNSKSTPFSSEKNSLEQVYDFESHLNADENELDNEFFPRYSPKNKSSNNLLKNNVSCKLSLKLNRRKNNDVLDEYIPEPGVSLNYTPQKIMRPRRTSSVVSYNEDQDPLPEENQVVTEMTKQNSSKDTQILSECENSAPEDINSDVDSGEISDWSIDDIPTSQLHPQGSLKCTISKKSFFASHANEKIPIPKFKVRKKKRSKSLNVSIKLRKHSLDGLDGDPDLLLEKKSYYCISSKNNKESKKSPKKSHTYASAFDVKQKYKKHKKSRKECLKNAILQYCNSMIKTKNSNQQPFVQTSEPEINHFAEKSDFYEQNIPISSTNFSSKNEVSDISHSSFTEKNSDDNKKTKNSLKIKLKLKRLTTRSNEERIIVVGKELEGIDTDTVKNKNQEISSENVEQPKLNDFENSKIKEYKKTLGTKNIKCSQNDFKLKTKFICPLQMENRKVEKHFTEMKPEVNKENYKEKIPKFKYKPLLSSISSDLLPKNECNVLASHLLNDVPSHKTAVVSPKKKSPLKNAESIKKELAQLNEMAYVAESSDINNVNSNDKSVISNVNIDFQNKLKDEKVSTLLNVDILSSTQYNLLDKKSSLEYIKKSQRNSLLCQDFKKHFDSSIHNEALKIMSSDKKFIENFECDLPDFNSTCVPCSIDIEKLSASEVEKYICKPVVNLEKTEIAIPCDPAIASFPSPVVDAKNVDSYIDPRKVFKNLFTFSSPSPSHSHSPSPLHFNNFETSSLMIENDMSCGPFSNENSEHSRKEFPKATDLLQNPLKPSDVFKSVEREDMGVLWNLSYFSPPQVKLQDINNVPTSVIRNKVKSSNDQKDNSTLIDELQKLAKEADEVCSLSCHVMNSENENSLSLINDKVLKVNCETSTCSNESKISFENILDNNIKKVLDDLENIPSFSQAPIEFEEKQVVGKKTETASSGTEITTLIKEEPKSDPVFEPMESLPNVCILDFQECLVESDSEMNPLLNDSEIDSVMSSADMILANNVDLQNYEHSLQTDLTFDDPTSNSIAKPKCVLEEPKNDEIDMFYKNDFDPPLQKQLDTDLTCNDAIITAADTSSLLIPSFKSNTIPVLAINNPCQETTVNFAALEEQNFSANGQFFPVVLAPVSVAENSDYLENPSAIKENVPDSQECVTFLEDNELLQSCSVSSTSDIENKNAQTSNSLNIPFNGEEDILSMIVKSCDIGEEYDVNMNSVEETESESISSALCNTLVDSNYVMAGSNIIISSQPEQNSLQTNSENAVSSSSENNLLQKNPDIVVIKTEPIDVPGVEHILYEIQDKDLSLSHTKSFKPSEEIEHDDNVLLDSMIHSFYGDVSLLCPTFQKNAFHQDNQKISTENNLSFKSSAPKIDDNASEMNKVNSYKPDSYFKNLSVLQNDSSQLKNSLADSKTSLNMLSNSLMLARSFPKVSSKRFHFTPCFRPPTRESLENSLLKTEIEDSVKLNIATEDDSLSSNSSLGSQTIKNDPSESNMSNKILSETNSHPGFQKFQGKNNSIHKVCLNSPIIYHDRTTSNVSFNHLLASTPSTSNIKKEFSLSNAIVSPINKDTGLIADTNKRKRKLVFEDESDSPLKLLKSETEKMHDIYHKYGRKGSVDSLGNLSFSQIDGPTLENSRGFKVCSENYGDAQIRHEIMPEFCQEKFVLAKWKDNHYYPAIIIKNKSDTVIVRFTEDNIRYEVKKEFVKMRESRCNTLQKETKLKQKKLTEDNYSSCEFNSYEYRKLEYREPTNNSGMLDRKIESINLVKSLLIESNKLLSSEKHLDNLCTNVSSFVTDDSSLNNLTDKIYFEEKRNNLGENKENSEVKIDKIYCCNADSDSDECTRPEYAPANDSESEICEKSELMSESEIESSNDEKRLPNETKINISSEKQIENFCKNISSLASGTSYFNNFIEENSIDIPDPEECGITIISTDGTENKKNYCLYCFKPFTKLPRHMETTHSDEKETNMILNTNTSEEKKERGEILYNLKNLGNHIHISKVLQKNKGNLVVVYNPSKNVKIDPYKYIPCKTCLGYFYAKDLWKRKCPLRKEKNKNQTVFPTGRTFLSAPIEIDSIIKEMLSSMWHDKITNIIKNEKTICKFMRSHHSKGRNEIRKRNEIRNNAREESINHVKSLPIVSNKLFSSKNHLDNLCANVSSFVTDASSFNNFIEEISFEEKQNNLGENKETSEIKIEKIYSCNADSDSDECTTPEYAPANNSESEICVKRELMSESEIECSNDEKGLPNETKISISSEKQIDNFCKNVSSLASSTSYFNNFNDENSIEAPDPKECRITIIGTNGTENKKNYCPYCFKQFSKFPRHMETAHSDEKEINMILTANTLEEKKERWKILYKLKNLGNHIHNSKVLRKNKGSLVVVYRPPKNVKIDPYKYIPCKSCLGYFSAKDLWKHKCPLRKEKNKNERVVATGKILLPAPIETDSNIKEMLSSMKHDKITNIMKNEIHKKNEIRNNAREESINHVKSLTIESNKLFSSENHLDNLCANVSSFVTDASSFKNFIEEISFEENRNTLDENKETSEIKIDKIYSCNTDTDKCTMPEYAPANDSESEICVKSELMSESEIESSNDEKELPKETKISISSEKQIDNFCKNVSGLASSTSYFNNFTNEDSIEATDPKEYGITIIGTNGTENKKNYCPYCFKQFSKLPRHMETAHSDEKEINMILTANTLEEKKERWKILYKLKNLGNHIHNSKVLRKNKGSLVVVYRPPKNVKIDPYKYIPCKSCLGYFSAKDLWKHKCPLRKEKKKNERVVATGRTLLPAPIETDSNIKEMLSSMRHDKITNIIKNEKSICQELMRIQHSKGTNEIHKRFEMRNNAREESINHVKSLPIESNKLFSSENHLDNLCANVSSFVTDASSFNNLTDKISFEEKQNNLGENKETSEIKIDKIYSCNADSDSDERIMSEYAPAYDSESEICIKSELMSESEIESSNDEKGLPNETKISISSEKQIDNFCKNVSSLASSTSYFNNFNDENSIEAPDPKECRITIIGTNGTENKKNYCPYCFKQFSKLPRHMETAHSDEKEINMILTANTLEEKKERWKILYKLKNLGNHIHNSKVLRKNKGSLVVVYRPPKNVKIDPYKYIPCKSCLGYFSAKDLWKHKCPLRKEKKKNERVVATGRTLLPAPIETDSNIKEMLSSMRHDKITNIIKNEKSICEELMRIQHSKGGNEIHKRVEMRNNAREESINHVKSLPIESNKLFSSENHLDNLCANVSSFVTDASSFNNLTDKISFEEKQNNLGENKETSEIKIDKIYSCNADSDSDERIMSEYAPAYDSESEICIKSELMSESEIESSNDEKGLPNETKISISSEKQIDNFCKNVSRLSSSTSYFNNFIDENSIDIPDPEECGITIIGTDGTENKKNYCPYCFKPFAKLPRHMETAHSDEKEINMILTANTSKEKKERGKILYKLKNLGNHIHNSKVLRKNKGTLVVVYRPPKNVKIDPYKYIPCKSCLGYFSAKDLWKHKCPLRKEKKKNERVVATGRTLLPAPIETDSNIKEMLSSMRHDKITNIIKNEKTICEFIRRSHHSKGGNEIRKRKEIRNNAREIARLLQEVRNLKGEKSFSVKDMIDPIHYKTIIDAVRIVSGYDEEKQNFCRPELGRKLGLHIKTCANIVQSFAIEIRNDVLLGKTENFLKLHETKFLMEIGAEVKRYKNKKGKLIQNSGNDVEVSLDFDTEVETELKEFNFTENSHNVSDLDENDLQKDRVESLKVRDREKDVAKQEIFPLLKSHKKRAWTIEEKIAVKKHLEHYILAGKIPGADAIRKCIAAESSLKQRSWRNIKDFCRNQIISIHSNVK